MPTPQFALRLDPALRARVKAAAQQCGTSESAVVRELVRRARPEDLGTPPLSRPEEAKAEGAEAPERAGTAA